MENDNCATSHRRSDETFDPVDADQSKSVIGSLAKERLGLFE